MYTYSCRSLFGSLAIRADFLQFAPNLGNRPKQRIGRSLHLYTSSSFRWRWKKHHARWTSSAEFSRSRSSAPLSRAAAAPASGEQRRNRPKQRDAIRCLGRSAVWADSLFGQIRGKPFEIGPNSEIEQTANTCSTSRVPNSQVMDPQVHGGMSGSSAGSRRKLCRSGRPGGCCRAAPPSMNTPYRYTERG